MRFIRFRRHLRLTRKRREFLTLVWSETSKYDLSVKKLYNYVNNVYKTTQLKSLKEYICLIIWLHPVVKLNYWYAYKQGWGNFFSKLPISTAFFYFACYLLAHILGGWPIFYFIIIGIFFYALIWSQIQYWINLYTPSGHRSVSLYRVKKMQKIQKYLIKAALNKKRYIVRYKNQKFFKETSLKLVRQRWTLGKTKFQSYMFNNNRKCKNFFDFFDANRYIIKHHISYYRHDIVLDPLARTLSNQESFRDYLLLNNLLILISAEFKAKGYILGNGDLEIKKIYAKDYVYNHKNNSRIILACYALCWVSKNKKICIPVLSLGPWAIDNQERKPWYVIIDTAVSKEAFKQGYRLRHIFDSMWITKTRAALPSYDVIFNTPPIILPKKQWQSAKRQIVIEARARYNLPLYKKARRWYKHQYMLYTSRFANPRANFKQISDYKFAKKWDRKNPRLGYIFNWLETEGRWYYFKYRFCVKLKYRLVVWCQVKVYPFIYWCLIVFVASVFFSLYKLVIKYLPSICKAVWKYIKIIFKCVILVPQIFKLKFMKMVTQKKLQINLNDCDQDKYLFGRTETGLSWYCLYEMKLNRVRRLIWEKLWLEKQSDEHMLELRHDIVVGHIDRVVKENWYLIYDYASAYTIESMARRPLGKNERNSNLWHLSDIFEYRLVAEHCFEADIYRENLADTLLYLCANMDTYVPQVTVDEKTYVLDMLDFFCIFPMVIKLETLPIKNVIKIERKIQVNDYIVDNQFQFLDKLKDNFTLFSRINQNYIKDDLIFYLSAKIAQSKKVKRKRGMVKSKFINCKAKNKKLILKKFSQMNWNELNLYL